MLTVCFPLNAEHPKYPVRPRARRMIASVREHMPHARLVQLTSEDYPAMEGVDEVLRHPERGDFSRWLLETMLDLFKQYRGNVISLGTDMVVQADLSPVFDYDFDFAGSRYPLTTRPDRLFCFCGLFFKPDGYGVIRKTLRIYNNNPVIQDGWMGSELALFCATFEPWPWMVRELDFDVFNRTPNEPGTDLSGAKLVHYRGPRKRFMLTDHPLIESLQTAA